MASTSPGLWASETGGLVAGVEPQPLALVANFDTDDPVAEVKRKKDRKRALREDEAAN